MPRTQISSNDIGDECVKRDDLNETTPGQAVTKRIIAGVGININETGVDTGTGDVTINADPVAQVDAVQRLLCSLPRRVPGGGEIFMRHEGDVAYSEVPLVLAVNYELQEVSIAVDNADASNDYTVRFYTDPAGAPVLQHSPLTLTSTNSTASVTGLSLALNAGNWGVALARTAGGGNSDFRNVIISFLIVKV